MTVRATPIVRVAPLSPGQERLLAAEYVEPCERSPDGDRPGLRRIDIGAVRLDGSLRLDALEQAVHALVDRQESLRTTFRVRRDAPAVQLVLAERKDAFAVRDAHGERFKAVLEAVTAIVRRPPPDPADTDLFAVQVLRIAPERHVVVLQIHHLVSDGWSIGVLHRELMALYEASVRGVAPDLPSLTLAFGEHCARLRAERSGARLAAQTKAWRDELAAPWSRLPLPHPRDPSGGATSPVNDEPLTFASSLVDALRVAGRTADVRGGIAGPMLAALGQMLHSRTGATDVRIGTMVAARTPADTEHLIGNFVNVVTIRFEVHGDEPLDRLLTCVNAKVAAALDRQEAPIQDVHSDLVRSGVADPSQPLFEVTFALNTMQTAPFELQGLRSTPLAVSATGESRGPRFAPTNIALRWVLFESPAGLHGSVTYDMRRFSKRTIHAYVADFERALRAIAALSGAAAGGA